MFYSNKLEEVIFNFDDTLSEEPDELIIISGYLGPNPVRRLADLPYNTFVIGGMYNNGINRNLLSALNEAKDNNPKMKLKFSNVEIHSKLYVWRKNKNILSALIGSANFSSNGLHSNLREILAQANRGTFPQMEEYIKRITSNLVDEPPITKKNQVKDLSTSTITEIENLDLLYTFELPLYSENKSGIKRIYPKSGVNWGRSSGNVAPGDAYIRITKDIIRDHPTVFKPYDPNYKNKHNNKKKQSEPIEIIWDDGFTMEASLEGSQDGKDGKKYPKHLTSYSIKRPQLEDGTQISAKSILGRYLRSRMGIKDLNYEITYEDLISYGRDTITLSFIEEGLFYCDFSVSTEKEDKKASLI
ncbi:NgoFVII family restriction endonuclease [Alkalibacterium iburiense]|uniref:NgoFVII family restriction endonuclease n=1 Tax=Alkalibacterium iburiense TaxID=290589 RepID=A0ABP3GUW5_9LACT